MPKPTVACPRCPLDSDTETDQTRHDPGSAIITDLSYAFTGLKAGPYCVCIDPQREPDLPIPRPGELPYPAIEQGVISTAVTLDPGEYRGKADFGWDYQNRP